MTLPTVRRGIALLGTIALISSCATAGTGADTAAIAIAPDASASHLVFRVYSGAYIYGLAVTTCTGSRAMWVIGTSGASTPVSSITYGEVPKGFAEHTGPLPLTPGCYEAKITNSVPVRFVVEKNGTIAAAR
jgi:hypothetical protein